jgi:hypothetical protein
MPESIPSAYSSHTIPTEWLLARITDPTRAAAILGDLTEMEATRGRLWFWLAYARTLVELGWRVPFSFVFGCAIFSLIYCFFVFWGGRLLHDWRFSSPYTMHEASYLYLFHNIVTTPMWFIASFAVARYGVHDRFARLALLLSLASTCALVYPRPITLLFMALTLCAIAVSLFSEQWRKPVFVLAATTASGTAAYLGMSEVVAVGFWYFRHGKHFPIAGDFAAPHRIFWIAMWTIAISSMFIVTFVCTRLHRWLLERPASTDRGVA